MTVKEIREQQAMENAKYDTAAAIRELLDALKKKIGPTKYEEDSVEEEVLEMVTND